MTLVLSPIYVPYKIFEWLKEWLFHPFGKDTPEEQISDLEAIENIIKNDQKPEVNFGKLKVHNGDTVTVSEVQSLPAISCLIPREYYRVCVMILDLGLKAANVKLPQLNYLFINDLRMENIERKLLVGYKSPEVGHRYAILIFEQRDGVIGKASKFLRACTRFGRLRFGKIFKHYNLAPLYSLAFYVNSDD
ncbi:hypothetical protein ACOME3_004687 [Neoechinorhynchus agilis]